MKNKEEGSSVKIDLEELLRRKEDLKSRLTAPEESYKFDHDVYRPRECHWDYVLKEMVSASPSLDYSKSF